MVLIYSVRSNKNRWEGAGLLFKHQRHRGGRRGRERNGATHTQNADRDRAKQRDGTDPNTGQNRGQSTTAREPVNRRRDHTRRPPWETMNPGTRQPAGATRGPHLDPPAPGTGQLSQKDPGPCRQRDIRPHQ